MTWAILVINIKGGTGKSTVAEVLARELDSRGYSVGMFDGDIDSANLSSRLGSDDMVSFKGDHDIEPVEHDGMKLYSMENAFDDSTFLQTGDFMGDVVDNMVNHSDWGELDYMVVDCPPGSSDVFDELVRSLRVNILGAISVGISDAVEDTARLVKVCNHSWVPILGFIENMSGLYCHGDSVSCGNVDEGGFGDSHDIEPFGSGNIEQYANEVGGKFLGKIPLSLEDTDISKAAKETLDNTIEEIEKADKKENWPPLPEDNLGDRSFIRNVWGAVRQVVDQINKEMDVEEAQDEFGVEQRDPLTLEIELEDATGIKKALSGVIINIERGEIDIVRRTKARSDGMGVDSGIVITSQNLYDALSGRKKVMDSTTGEIITAEYSITEAIKMGDASMWGDKPINRVMVLDRMLSTHVDTEKITRQVRSSTT